MSPELSGPGSFGPLSFVRRKKRLCQNKDLENSMNTVAISVSKKKVSYLCELPNRDSARTVYKCPIMVKPFVPTEPKEEDVEMPQADGDELPDFGAEDQQPQPQLQPQPLTEGDIRVKYRFPTWEDQADNLKTIVKKTGIHPVDPICVCCKTTPIPMKDMDPNKWLERLSPDGWYGGHSIHKALSTQEHSVIIEDKVVKTSRWAALFLNMDLRIKDPHAELRAIRERKHAHCEVLNRKVGELGYRKDGSQYLSLIHI